MLLIGQSLQFQREPDATILRERDAAALVARALAQRAAGAQALDLNAGVEGSAIDLEWAARTLRPALFAVPLFLDAGAPAALAVAFELCEREGVFRPLVANALPAETVTASDGQALLRAVARARAGLVISPRLAADAADAGASAVTVEVIVAAAAETAVSARAAGVNETLYLDALAYPALHDAARCRRSLAVLRAYRDLPGVERLVAVGNAGYGAPPALAAALRAVYAAAAAGAGATALLLPVAETATLRAVRLASGEAAPGDDGERWLAALAAAAATGALPPPAPAAYAAAARLLFGG